MIILESPMETLAFKYFNDAGILTAFTWAAVITAAVSFWKIKGIYSLRGDKTDAAEPATAPAYDKSDPHHPSISPENTPYCVEGCVKTKFSSYYGVDVVREEDDCVEEDADDGHRTPIIDREFKLEYGGDWEKTTAMRKMDMGWYRSQDLTVLDGSVVRLWNHGVGHRHLQVKI